MIAPKSRIGSLATESQPAELLWQNVSSEGSLLFCELHKNVLYIEIKFVFPPTSTTDKASPIAFSTD